jgi:TonB family protein
MVRGLAVWAAATAFAGLLGAQQAPPKLIYQERPIYPELAKQARIQGAVELKVWISAEGTVDQIKLISGHPLLVKAAMDAVKEWRFRPAWWSGEPVAAVISVSMRFTFGLPGIPGCDQSPIVLVQIEGSGTSNFFRAPRSCFETLSHPAH